MGETGETIMPNSDCKGNPSFDSFGSKFQATPGQMNLTSARGGPAQILKLLLLCFWAVTSVAESHAQEKPAWTANPALVFPHQGAYPASITVRLFFNACNQGGVTKQPAPAPGVGYGISVTGVGVSADKPTPGDCSLTTTLTITSATQPGHQMLTVRNGIADAGFAVFDFMDATAGPTPAAPQVDVFWEVLTDHICSDNFGNHMPGDLYCVEMKIGNNSGHSLQLAGVGFLRESPQCKSADSKEAAKPCTEDPISTPNVGYPTVRASAQAGQSTTKRNILVNGAQAVGLLMGSFTPFFRNEFNKGRWGTGASIVSGSLAQAINIVAPDQTLHEINNLDDQAFREGKLIPNNTQVRLLVFVQKKSLAEAIGEIVPKIKNANEVQCENPVQVGYKREPGRPDRCYPAWENRLGKCVRKQLECNPVIIKLALGKMVIIGDQIDFIQRVVVDSSVTSQRVGVPANTKALATQPVITPPLVPEHGAVGALVAINGINFGTNQGTVMFNGTVAIPASWSDTIIMVPVPPGAITGNVVVTTISGVASNGVNFTVP